jgi:hypothetical protein
VDEDVAADHDIEEVVGRELLDFRLMEANPCQPRLLSLCMSSPSLRVEMMLRNDQIWARAPLQAQAGRVAWLEGSDLEAVQAEVTRRAKPD